MLGFQHTWKKFPDLPERCQTCARIRTPENEALECMKPAEPLNISLYADEHK